MTTTPPEPCKCQRACEGFEKMEPGRYCKALAAHLTRASETRKPSEFVAVTKRGKGERR